jgi:hypothetical protein
MRADQSGGVRGPLMECECCVALLANRRAATCASAHVPLVEGTRLNSAHSRTLSRCNVDVSAQERIVGYPQVLRVVASLQVLAAVDECECRHFDIRGDLTSVPLPKKPTVDVGCWCVCVCVCVCVVLATPALAVVR